MSYRNFGPQQLACPLDHCKSLKLLGGSYTQSKFIPTLREQFNGGHGRSGVHLSGDTGSRSDAYSEMKSAVPTPDCLLSSPYTVSNFSIHVLG
ncbi:hypothetical protein EGR_05255 [Echinococcus granulosus]|uniref:Uncharacterized protein n=1 Tax=Echinococcus granulosus TaxID=6210 RepID=W6V1Y9_ECHGR|nr:hypothetical protein EGR_05255 [Echinococcus granulosus]EUB59929.1 hypothetical protein EGR_05255 [Echinococcus granulosus]